MLVVKLRNLPYFNTHSVIFIFYQTTLVSNTQLTASITATAAPQHVLTATAGIHRVETRTVSPVLAYWHSQIRCIFQQVRIGYPHLQALNLHPFQKACLQSYCFQDDRPLRLSHSFHLGDHHYLLLSSFQMAYLHSCRRYFE